MADFHLTNGNVPPVAHDDHHKLLQPADGFRNCRDLKLDNLLLDMADPPRILLTDFGFAARWGANETPNMRGHLGCAAVSCAPSCRICHEGPAPCS